MLYFSFTVSYVILLSVFYYLMAKLWKLPYWIQCKVQYCIIDFVYSQILTFFQLHALETNDAEPHRFDAEPHRFDAEPHHFDAEPHHFDAAPDPALKKQNDAAEAPTPSPRII
jgi:hypothetical protein